MPHRMFGIEEVARYLHLSKEDVERLVKNQDIPFEKMGERVVFRKVEVDEWASRRILGLHGQRLADYHTTSSNQTRSLLPQGAMMPSLIEPTFIDPALPAKTKASVLREMANLAEKTGRVADPRGLWESLQAREALCSTGIPGGMALLHPRNPDPYLIETPFVALGRTVQEIPFGAPDRKPTRLFFIIGCPDDRLHLHTLARICLMAQKAELLSQLQNAPDAESMHQIVLESEATVLEARKG